ncbi:MAG: hypothetical protein J6Q69_01050 [Clostridia bacterium]|nr:hypothetical protein [Clostridia bacterium]
MKYDYSAIEAKWQKRWADENAFVAPLYGFNMLNPWNYCLDMKAQASHPAQKQVKLVPDYVKECHDRGIRVHVWTVNTEEDKACMLDAVVDAIITNYPDIARSMQEDYANEQQ